MLFAVGVAKSCVGHAASVVVRGAHQALGAIGTTLEHELHTLTKPILARRSEYGSLQDWDETLTALAVVRRSRPALDPHHDRPRQTVECTASTPTTVAEVPARQRRSAA